MDVRGSATLRFGRGFPRMVKRAAALNSRRTRNEDGGLHSLGAEPVQGFLARLNRPRATAV